jgi:hypothetical protein
MATVIDPSAIFSGAPVSLLYGGVECGSTTKVPKLSLQVESGGPDFTNAGGPVVATRYTRRIIPSVEITVNELTAQKLAWAMPGATATSSASLGQLLAGYDTTLAADPALGATNVKVTSVTTVTIGQFVSIGPVATPTELNTEIVRVLTVGTTGGGGTGLDIENDGGTGLRIDHANAERIYTVNGSILSAPAAAGAVNIKVDSVAGLIVGDFVRIGYLGHYETRVLTFVGTALAGGTGISFAIPLTRDHGLDEWVVEVTAQGGTTIRPVVGRIATAAYQSLVLTDIGADGRTLIVTLENAMSAETQELDFDDDPANPLGLTLKFTAHYAAATPTTVPITIVMSA